MASALWCIYLVMFILLLCEEKILNHKTLFHCICKLITAAIITSLTASCSQIEKIEDVAIDSAKYAAHYDHVDDDHKNAIQRYVALCSEKTELSESECIRNDIRNDHLTLQKLIGSFPGCKSGMICQQDYATHDRLGFVEATTTAYTVRWRIRIDLRKEIPDIEQVPISVLDLDSFESDSTDPMKNPHT